MTFAGLWDEWKDKATGEVLKSCTMLITEPSDFVAAALTFRSWALWLFGYPDAALADAEHALKHAREIGQAGTLMYALTLPSWISILCGEYAAANAHSDEAVALAEEKGTLFWKAQGTVPRGCVLALTSKASGFK